jgi:hypothetical protein
MKKQNFKKHFQLLALFLGLAITASAQTTVFNYQGKLTDGGAAANGSFQMQFKLFDAVSGGTQIGATLADVPVTATNGVFSTKLDFGANALSGANRWLEIAVRRNAGENYVTLSPREQIASSPYAVRTLSAASADNALNLGGVPASEYVTNSTVGSSFIRNDTTQQTGNFNISGNGTIGTQLGVGRNVTPGIRIDSQGTIRSVDSISTGILAETTGGTNSWAKFYMISPSRRWSVGTSQNFNGNQFFLLDETAGQFRMSVATNGFVGFGTTNPQSGLELGGTGAQVQQRITDNASGNSLVLQSGAGANTKITGYNYGSSTAVPLYLSVDGANTILNSGGGNVGIGTATPNAKLTVVGNTTQDLSSFGMPKAMILVDPNANILRCYNGTTGVSTGNCGFSVTKPNTGLYKIDFGFQVNNRFFSLAYRWQANDRFGTITTSDDSTAGFPAPLTVNQIYVLSKLIIEGTSVNSTFYVIVY